MGDHGQRRLAGLERVRPAEPGGYVDESRSATTDLDYDDTWGFALGTLQIHAGVVMVARRGYDTSPMSKSQRTPALPLDRQIRVGTGVQYALNERMTIGGAYAYLNLGARRLDRDTAPSPGASKATTRPTKSTS